MGAIFPAGRQKWPTLTVGAFFRRHALKKSAGPEKIKTEGFPRPPLDIYLLLWSSLLWSSSFLHLYFLQVLIFPCFLHWCNMWISPLEINKVFFYFILSFPLLSTLMRCPGSQLGCDRLVYLFLNHSSSFPYISAFIACYWFAIGSGLINILFIVNLIYLLKYSIPTQEFFLLNLSQLSNLHILLF